RRALKPLRGEARRPHAAPGGLGLGEVGVARTGALPLDEAPGEARRQRDRVADAARVEAEQPRGRRGAAEDAVDRARAKAVRRWPAPTSPTVTAWFTNAFALSTMAAGSSS